MGILLFSPLNAIGILLKCLGINRVAFPEPHAKSNLFLPVDVVTGVGLVTRTPDEIHLLLGIFKVAAEKYYADNIKPVTRQHKFSVT